VLEPEGFTFEGGFSFPPLPAGSPVTHPLGLLYNSAMRLLLARSVSDSDRTGLLAGIELSGSVLAGELQCRHIPIALQTLLLRSQVHSLLGNDRMALQDLSEAVELAAPQGFISPFLEEGPQVLAGLRALQGSGKLDSACSAHVEAILEAVPSPAPIARTPRLDEDQPIEALTPRELEVLGLIASGDSNRAIAEKLVITLSAVKKHSGNIFHKLNVNSRTQAILRARQLALLPPDR
jgi:ATP/maltotriose-dependent transcriptional regulator MalT